MKSLHYFISASLVCGAVAFTGCSDDSTSNASSDKSPKQAAFIENTHNNMKSIAENLNFSSWKAANAMNLQFNEMLLTNPDFEKSVSTALAQQIPENTHNVKEGTELAKLGFKKYTTIDLNKLKYKYIINEDKTGFDTEESDNLEIIIPGLNPQTNKQADEMFKLTIKSSDETTKCLNKTSKKKDLAKVLLIPNNISFTIESKASGSWRPIFNGEFTNKYKSVEKSNYVSLVTDKFTISGKIQSTLKGLQDLPSDEASLEFSFSQDPTSHKSNAEFTFVHNDRHIVSLNSTYNNKDGMTDFSAFSLSNSIIDLLEILTMGHSVEKQEINLLDDMIITAKISDSEKMFNLHKASNAARRKYADEATIKKYTDQMNDLMTLSIESLGTNQKLDAKLVAYEFGVDYMTMPAVKFEDSNEYIPLFDMIDRETIEYAVNILDHSLSPMSDAIVVARQLVQYFNSIIGKFTNEEEGESEE